MATPASGPARPSCCAYQVDEIDGAGLTGPDEDARLEAEEDRLAEASAHREAAAAALAALAGSTAAPGGTGRRRPARPRPRAPWPGGHPWSRSTGGVPRGDGRAGRPGRRAARRWSRPGRTTPQRLEEVRTRRQLLHELARKYGAGPRRGAGHRHATPGPRLADLASLEAPGGRPGRRDRRGPAAPRWPTLEARGGPGAAAGRPRCWPREIEATLHDLAMPSARFAIAVEGDGQRRRRRPSSWPPTPASPACPWPRRRRAASWPGPCWPSAWRSPTPRSAWSSTRWTPGWAGRRPPAVGAALAGLGHYAPGAGGHPPGPGGGPGRPADRGAQGGVRRADPRPRSPRWTPTERVVEISRMLSGSPDSESARRHTPGSCSGTRRPRHRRGPR